MKLLVKKTFKDKYTKEIYEAGTTEKQNIIEIADDRAVEMLNSPYNVVEKVEEKEDEAKIKKK